MSQISLDEDKSIGKEDGFLKGKKVFIVEDDVFLGSMISQRISVETSDVSLFKNGEDALKALETSIPDIIVLDIFLPGIDGFEVLQKVRDNEKIKNIPVLIVSNINQPDNKKRAETLGAQFLLKALVTPHDIVGKMNMMLKG
ncbi:MAG: response regulator [Candidatus Parcubacteria bacterium]|nr:response regulator [Candidatus Parcubacteria bacterium]